MEKRLDTVVNLIMFLSLLAYGLGSLTGASSRLVANNIVLKRGASCGAAGVIQ
ncbi:Uncharacterised protein [Klebsiella variicola]|uniref:Uncharacterized protein n=1 Tax=Klebsiella variicola TaxID=244366 RepID=A0A7H4MJX2_KLEVA|nr:Uncharacterised protein [Klebsiella variicola]